jgi:hypothetical protein
MKRPTQQAPLKAKELLTATISNVIDYQSEEQARKWWEQLQQPGSVFVLELARKPAKAGLQIQIVARMEVRTSIFAKPNSNDKRTATRA